MCAIRNRKVLVLKALNLFPCAFANDSENIVFCINAGQVCYDRARVLTLCELFYFLDHCNQDKITLSHYLTTS